VYDSYEVDSLACNEEYKKELHEHLIFSSCSLIDEQWIQQIIEPRGDILELEKEKFSNEENKLFHFGQQEEVIFLDPVAIYIKLKWGNKLYVVDFLEIESQNCKYGLPDHFLNFVASPILFVFKVGREF